MPDEERGYLMGVTSIEWTERSWNPIRGTKGRHICQRVSPGCKNCYAATINRRFSGIDYVAGADTPRLDERALVEPLRWRTGCRAFVCSMSDLFWDAIQDEWIDRIFAVMAQCPQHIFQVLTKRPERMLAFLSKATVRHHVCCGDGCPYCGDSGRTAWRLAPYINVHLGVSVENQETANARIPLLLQTPAAVRWCSYEPALGPVDFSRWLLPQSIRGLYAEPPLDLPEHHRLNWVVVGGESGPSARPFDLAWARQTIAQGRAAGVPVFVKQLGARPIVHDTDFGQLGEYVRCSEDGSNEARFRDRKGGDMQDWPSDLRVREFPTGA